MSDRQSARAIGSAISSVNGQIGAVVIQTGAFTTTATKTGTYTAAANELVPCDATGGSFAVTLPAASTAGQVVAVKKLDASTNAVTVQPAGSDVINLSATSATLSLQNQSLVVVSSGSEVWTVEANDLPLGQLDVRYAAVASAALVANRTSSTVVAHRGGGSAQGGIYQGPFPEETHEAYEACLADGLIYLNPHVVMLSDGALVLMHDATPDRTTNATGSVGTYNYTTSAWRKLKVTPSNTALWPGYGVDWGEQHPPFFSEYLERFGGRAAHVIECTNRGWQGSGVVSGAVVAALQQRGLAATAIIQSFAAADLTAAAAVGIETMYLPPDLGTAGSDSASIATAMTSGWASGKPKHVGINAFPSGQTQAQVVTYIGTLVAAGFTVWAWTLCRRYHQTWLAAAGVVGFITDEPAYFNVSGRVNRGSVDATSLGVWPHGFLPADQSHGRGNLTNGGAQLDYASGSTGTQFCCYGAFSPPTSVTAYTVQGDFVWDVLDADATRHMDLLVCCPDDRPTSVTIGTGSGLVDGYQVLFRQNAANLTVARLSQSGQTIANLLIQTTGLPPAASAGTVTTMKVQVTATQLIVSLIQASTTYGPFTVTDSTYRGGYFHVGKAYGAGTKLVGTWKNISCA